MKQLIQSFKTGKLGLFRENFFAKAKIAFASFEIPAPVCGENGALVQTTVSLVSAGTEKMLVDFTKSQYLQKLNIG